MLKFWTMAITALLATYQPVYASEQAHADIIDSKGRSLGHAELKQTPNGVLITLELTIPGKQERAFHIHEVGVCDAPDFASAGGHFNPRGLAHGLKSGHGHHAGDMPNLFFPESGELKQQIFNSQVSLIAGEDGYLLDEDGSSFIIHAGPDDYATDPSGEAGGRIACGVITATK